MPHLIVVSHYAAHIWRHTSHAVSTSDEPQWVTSCGVIVLWLVSVSDLCALVSRMFACHLMFGCRHSQPYSVCNQLRTGARRFWRRVISSTESLLDGK